MNEEELKIFEKKIWIDYKNSYGNRIKQFENNEWIKRMIIGAINQGFQKGKLEVLNKLNETYPDLKTQEDRKIFVKWKEQLQKEIGGMK